MSFILAMVWFPEVQKKAQKELDQVLGIGQLPEFSDESSLPYCSAVISEILRWRPIFPFGLPRLLESEEEYKGYRIPAGSIVMANSWYVSS